MQLTSGFFLLKWPKLSACALLLALSTVNVQGQVQLADTTRPGAAKTPDSLAKTTQVIVSGFMEPQYQVAQTKGITSFSGGNFSPYTNNRFIIRRGRPRITFRKLNAQQQLSAEAVFEIDGTERGISINEFWGKVYENKWQLFSFSTGMLVRPFSFEITQPTRLMETPERGRMSQTLMRGEVDLGGMICLEPRNRQNFLQYLKATLGIFNGQGLTASADYDGYKDLIARAMVKPYPVVADKLFLSGGFSCFSGDLLQNTASVYRMNSTGTSKQFIPDSSAANIGQKAPRQYYGADAQLKLKRRAGATEIRAEYWWGTQTATENSSETPTAVLAQPSYIRSFNGAFFYLLHNIVNTHHQLIVKLDWYDPNTKIKGQEIGVGNTNVTAANIKYTTLGLGYNYYVADNLKLTLWYDIVKNESTQLAGYTSDLNDNVLTCRLQFRF